jgi:hypothetical protein
VSFESGGGLSPVGDYSFSGCSSLRSIYLPSSIEAISPLSFINCFNLVNIVLEVGGHLSAESLLNLRSKDDSPWIHATEGVFIDSEYNDADSVGSCRSFGDFDGDESDA